jgi:hypothetical protein
MATTQTTTIGTLNQIGKIIDFSNQHNDFFSDGNILTNDFVAVCVLFTLVTDIIVTYKIFENI